MLALLIFVIAPILSLELYFLIREYRKSRRDIHAKLIFSSIIAIYAVAIIGLAFLPIIYTRG